MHVALILATMLAPVQSAIPAGWTNYGKPNYAERIATRFGSRYFVGASRGVIASTADTCTTMQFHYMPTDSSVFAFLVAKNTLVAFTNDGSYARTTDGLAWTDDTVVPGKTFRSVAWSGSELLAVATTGEVYRSTDLDTWTPQEETAPTLLGCMAHDGTRWVALNDSGASWSSSDGRIWQKIAQVGPKRCRSLIAFHGLYVASAGSTQESSDMRDWQVKSRASLAYVAGDSLYEIDFFHSTDNIAITGNGIDWSLSSVASLGSPLYYERFGSSAINVWSLGSIKYTRSATDAGIFRSSITYDYDGVANCGGRLVAHGMGFVQFGLKPQESKENYHGSFSPRRIACNDSVVVGFVHVDSILAGHAGKWIVSKTNAPALGTVRLMDQGIWTGNEFAVVGDGDVYYSTGTWKDDRGLAWTRQLSTLRGYKTNTIAIHDSLMIVVADGWVTRFVEWTRDTTRNIELPLKSYGNNGWVAWGNGRFVRLGNDSSVSLSEDGKTWTSRYDRRTQGASSLAFLKGRFYATTDSGYLLSSDSGTTWKVEARFDAGLSGVTIVGDTIVVSSGTMLATRRLGTTPPVATSPRAATAGPGGIRVDAHGRFALPEGVSEVVVQDVRGRVVARLRASEGAAILPPGATRSGRLFASWMENTARRTAPLLIVR